VAFDRFEGRLLVAGRVRALTPVRVGAGRAVVGTATDAPIVRDAFDRPYLPGASLRGALRAEIERFVRAVRPECACNPTGPEEERCLSPRARADIHQRLADHGTDGTGAALAAALVEASCWVCRLFGSPWLASRVQVADLPIDPATWPGRVAVRSGVAIDRDTGTPRPGLQHDYEVVPAGAEFLCQVRVETDDPRLLGMLAVGLRELEAGRLTLGGGRGRGLGRVRLVVERRALVRRDPASLLAYLADPAAGGAPVTEADVAAWTRSFVECLGAGELPMEVA
jgi:CRISPR-associated RAMP protein (TIGR02581 family)